MLGFQVGDKFVDQVLRTTSYKRSSRISTLPPQRAPRLIESLSAAQALAQPGQLTIQVGQVDAVLLLLRRWFDYLRDRAVAYPEDVWVVDQALFRATYEVVKP